MVNFGKQFENAFKESVPSNMYYLRLKDSPSSFGTNVATRFTLNQPFDCLVYASPNLFPFELKSTKSTSFSFKGTTPMIKSNQIKGLSEASKTDGVIAGFIFNFREPTNRAYFLHIENFNKFVEGTTKSSINEKDILAAGAVEIMSKLKKVKYSYMIKDFIEKLKLTKEENND